MEQGGRVRDGGRKGLTVRRANGCKGRMDCPFRKIKVDCSGEAGHGRSHGGGQMASGGVGLGVAVGGDDPSVPPG
jgi:hypothetical protein